MAKKKENKTKTFNLNEEIKKINPYLRRGFKKYIYKNNIEIKTEDEFNKELELYGGH